jgi:hypothetical protein
MAANGATLAVSPVPEHRQPTAVSGHSSEIVLNGVRVVARAAHMTTMQQEPEE